MSVHCGFKGTMQLREAAGSFFEALESLDCGNKRIFELVASLRGMA
jgi:hypothetical protein